MLELKNRSDGLIGMWLHTFDDDGDIDQQLQIVRRSGHVYLCKLYSWVDGNPSNCVAIHRDKILGLALYESCEAMNAAYERHEQRRKLERQTMAGLMRDFHPLDATA